MREWQPAKKAGRDIDSTVVFHIPFNPDIYSDRIWRQQQVLESCRGQFVDSMPVFPDDIRSLVMGNMGWPDDKVDKAVAICRFTVNENGEIMNIRVIKGTHPAFDKEAIRILSNFPRLIPAMKNSKPVPYDYFLTMRFWRIWNIIYCIGNVHRKIWKRPLGSLIDTLLIPVVLLL